MPVDWKRYPKEWKDISRRIRERDNDCCRSCGVEQGMPHPVTQRTVILTVAHLGTEHSDGRPGDKHDKMDVRDENLASLCQRCHLRFDVDEHVINARRTRTRKRIERALNSGQAVLWGGFGYEQA